MKLLNNYIAVHRVFNKKEESGSGFVVETKIPEKRCEVIYSGRDDIKAGEIVIFKHHDVEYIEKLEGGKERKLWFIEEDKVIAIEKQ